jgi:flagellar motor protein MotB
MKQIRATLLLLLVLAFATPELWAQGKKDKKPKEKTDKKKPDKNAQRELKREMMEYYYDIEKYEHAREEMANAKRKSDSLSKIAQEYKQKETQNNEEMQKIQDERTKNQEMVRKLEEDLKASAEKKEVPQEGTFFSIQIGAFNQGGSSSLHDLFKQNAIHLKVEDDPSGFKKYVVGGYTSYEQASAARKKFMQMGAKGAWIVAYKNGSRVPMTDVRSTPIPEEELKELEKIKKR